MKIQSMLNIGDNYNFRINDVIVLKIARTAILDLEITMLHSVYPVNIEEYYKSIKEQFDIEKMMNDLLSKNNKIKKVVIKNGICSVDDKIVFQISELKKYKIKV